MALPGEYRGFLEVCRYLKIDDGTEIGGLDYDGLYVTERPWLSKDHRAGVDSWSSPTTGGMRMATN